MRNLIANLGRFREGWDLATQSDRASLRCRLWLLTMIPDPSWTSWMRLLREDAASSFLCMGFSLVVAIGGYWTSLVAQMVKRLPTMREPWVQSLGWEDFWIENLACGLHGARRDEEEGN